MNGYLLVVPHSATAQIQWSVTGPADWNTGSNWDTGSVPGAGDPNDQASIINGGIAEITGTSPDVLGFRVGSFGASDVGIVNMSGTGSLLVTVFSSVGEGGTGTVNMTGSASIRSENDNFSVGAGGGTGLLDMSGSSTFLHTFPQNPFRGLQIGRDLGTGGTTGTVNIRDNASISVPAGLIGNGGPDVPFDGEGRLHIFGGNVTVDANQYQQSALSTLELDIDATGISPIVATHLVDTTNNNADPTVALDGTLLLNYQSAPSLGQSHLIIDNQFSDPVSGVFSLVDATNLDFNQFDLDVNYASGNGGNDVTVTVIACASAACGPMPATEFNWIGTSGDWNNGDNWDGGPPSTNEHTAIFGTTITSPQTVFTNTAQTVNQIQFNNANTYAVAGTGSVTLAANGGGDPPEINVVEGDHELQVDVSLSSGTQVNVTSGSLNFNNVLDLDGNDLNIQSGTVNINGQVLPGAGGMVNNSGTLGTAGATAFGGDLDTSGTLAVQIAGTGADQFSQFNVGGIADLSGLIDVSFIDGFSLGGGESFEILTAGTLVDNGIQLAAGGANDFFTLVVTPGANGSLFLNTGLAGDFDLDLDVDGADFLLWQRGGSNTPLSASDLAAWQANYGTDLNPLAASSTAVPEPATLLLMLAGLATVGLKRSREFV